MSKATATAKIRSDGTIVELLAGGTGRPFREAHLRPTTEAEIAAADADPDARPMRRIRRHASPR
jgi:putative transcriptional regulator